MSGSDQQITKTIEIEVPRTVVERARERAESEEQLEEYLLDEYYFEYQWDVIDD